MNHIEILQDLVAKLPNSLNQIPPALAAAHTYKENRDFISMICLLESVFVNVIQQKTELTSKQIKEIQNCLKLGYEITWEQFSSLSKKLRKVGLETLPFFDLDSDYDFMSNEMDYNDDFE